MTSRTSRRSIAEALVRLIEDGADNMQIARSIAAYLIQNGQVKQLDSLMRDVALLRAERGLLEVTTTSALPLTSEVKKHIEQTAIGMHNVEVNKVISNEIIDADVLGGVRIEIAGGQLDLTVRARLNRLKQATNSQRIA